MGRHVSLVGFFGCAFHRKANARSKAVALGCAIHHHALKTAGFKYIFLIGDHGQSQPVQAEVARKLSEEWKSSGVRVIQISEYYATAPQTALLEKQGFSRETIGFHASVIDTSELMAVHPKGVDLARYSRGTSSREPTGVHGNPGRSTSELGTNLLSMRIDAATSRIKVERH